MTLVNKHVGFKCTNSIYDTSSIYCIVCLPPKVKFSSITIYLTTFTLYYSPLPFPLVTTILLCLCIFICFSCLFVAFNFIFHIWVKSYGSCLFLTYFALIDGWFKKVWYIYTMENYLAIRKWNTAICDGSLEYHAM